MGYSAKDAKYLTNWFMINQKTTELAEVKIRASRCCCAAVQKGHMIEQVTNKRNQRARREIHKTVNTADKSD